jgi:hypothetical protein
MCLANYGASEAINLCSRYVEKSTKCSELKCANPFRESNQFLSDHRVFFATFTGI